MLFEKVSLTFLLPKNSIDQPLLSLSLKHNIKFSYKLDVQFLTRLQHAGFLKIISDTNCLAIKGSGLWMGCYSTIISLVSINHTVI